MDYDLFCIKIIVLKITVLGSGTSQGVPVIACPCDVCTSANAYDKRLRSSILLETDTTTVVVDAGPDFRQQMLRANVKKVDGILITHTHKDHIAGLDDVRSFNYLTKKAVKVFARPSDQQEIKQEFRYAFTDNPYPGVPEFELIDLNLNPFFIGDISIQPVELLHMKLKVFGFRFGDFAYLTDVNLIPDSSFKLLKGTKILMIDALHKRHHPSHFNLKEAIDAAHKIAAETTYFTHISHLMGRHKTINTQLPQGMHLAYDGLTFII